MHDQHHDYNQNSIGGTGTTARQRHHEKLIMQLESELSTTVQRLDSQRTAQVKEVEDLTRELRSAREERREMKARLDLAEQHAETLREELREQMSMWARERTQLEKQLAEAEAAADAARQSEGRIMAQAATLDSRIAAAQAKHMHSKEQDRLREELEHRATSQSDQITQLREKLNQLTAQMADMSHSRLQHEAELKRQVSENATLVAENYRLSTALSNMDEIKKNLETEKDHTASTKESLESALRLNETREKQINALQEALQAERVKATRMENARLQEMDLLRHQVDSLQQQCKQTERLRAEQVASFQDQLKDQRAQTLRLTEELAQIEGRAQQPNPRSPDSEYHQVRFQDRFGTNQNEYNDSKASWKPQGNFQRDFWFDPETENSPKQMQQRNYIFDDQNRVVNKVLIGKQQSQLPDTSTRRPSWGLPNVDHLYISDEIDMPAFSTSRSQNLAWYNNQPGERDLERSLVTDYVSRVLDETRELDDEDKEARIHISRQLDDGPVSTATSDTEQIAGKKKYIKKIVKKKKKPTSSKTSNGRLRVSNNNGTNRSSAQASRSVTKPVRNTSIPKSKQGVRSQSSTNRDPYEKMQTPRWRC